MERPDDSQAYPSGFPANALPVAAMVTDAEGVVLCLDPVLAEIAGCAADEMVGQPVGLVLADAPGASLEQSIRTAAASGQRSKCASAIRRKSGQDLPVEVTLTPVGPAGGAQCLVTARRIADRGSAEPLRPHGRAEEALLASEQINLEIVSSIQEGVIVYDRQLRYLLWNPFMERMTGVSASEVLGRSALEVFPELVERGVNELLHRALAGETVRPPDRPFRVPGTGRSGWISATYCPHLGPDGEIAGVIGTVHDVTARKAAEEALEESHVAQRTLMEGVDAGVLVIDPRTHAIEYVNPYAARLFGLPAKQVAGHVCHRFLCPGEMDSCPIAECGQEVKSEERILLRADGSQRPILKSVRWIRIAGQEKLLETFVDIADRQRADEKLRRSEERLRLTLDAAEMVAWEINLADGTHHESGPVDRLFGRPPGFRHDRIQDVAASIHPADRERVLGEVESALRGEREYCSEYRIALAGGAERWVSAKGRLLRDADGKPARLLGVAVDVTERKAAEARLRESDEEMRAAQRIAHIGSWMWDLRTDQASWSDETFRIFGMSPRELEGHRKGFIGLIHPGDKARVDQALTDAVNGTAAYDIEYRAQRPDGSVRLIHAQAEVVRDETGTPAFLRGTVHDVTERRRAEQALHDSQEKYRLTFHNIPAGVVVYEADGSVSLMNVEAGRLLGDEPAHGESVWFHDDGLVCAAEDLLVRRCFRTGEPQRDTVLGVRRQDGSVFWALYSATPMADPASGKVARVVLAFRDITERRQAEVELAESNEKFVKAFRRAPVLLSINSLADGTYIDVNDYALEASGFRREEVIGHTSVELGWITAGGRRLLLETLEREGRISGLELAFTTKDGRTLIGQVHGDRMVLKGQQCLLALTVDITERKRRDAEREQLEQQFQQAQKLESIGRLAGGVAHDFNNLLTVINGYSGLALAHLQAGDPLRDPLEEIRKAGARAAELTRQLLTFSRKHVVETRPVNLNELILESRGMLGRLVGDDIEIVTDLAAEPGCVMADADQLHQVLMNLVVNARDAMPEGGRIVLRSSRVQLDETASVALPGSVPGPYLVLEVSDTGLGMSDEIQRMMFDPFFTTKPEGAGTGLGLSTVYGIVRQAGGWIRVESQPGMGAAFRIGLPSIEESCPQAAPGALPLTQLEGPETVLVVEDQDEVRGLAVAVLKSFRYRTLEARSGGEAMLIAEHHPGPIHLMLTDVVMPQMTGKELAGRLGPLRPEMKVLYMSGYAPDVISSQGALDSGVEYIQKPFAPESLALKVRAVLGEPRPLGKVLVVDDEEAIRGLFARILAEGGYEVGVACDGEEAQKVLAAGVYDLVITDLVMPNREGIETIRAIRRDYPGLKIIAVSGAFGGDFLKAAAMLGSHATLVKPVSAEELLETVRKTLG